MRIIFHIISKLIATFEMVDMSFLAFYLRLKITYDQKKRTIQLSQLEYIKNLLDCHSMSKVKTAKMPI